MQQSGADTLPFACSCGSLSGHVTGAAVKQGFRILCHCADCRAVELYHGCPDPKGTGVDLLQLAPDMVRIDQGAEHLRLLQLSPRGLYRWYAGCCGTPLFNGLRKPKLPFIAVRSALFSDPDRLGKVVAQAFVPQPGKPPRHEGAGRMTMKLASRMISAWVSGRWRQTPLFDLDSGAPVAKPQVLSKAERQDLTTRP
ncbi:DUF6151 family protein [Epibacterium sp. Ofav1-8]|uniref:DUF6151 family protein n=1 Tax=Epibacterium sp. Ofav1-8 TaxID=2917735 RepID=UPI001EF63618|nr:DUF6151 family protein [Epibacterium sp. Ofav1-8]MCG7623153.1 GFA family protein [Epibacterium sp. Ofav1-8]